MAARLRALVGVVGLTALVGSLANSQEVRLTGAVVAAAAVVALVFLVLTNLQAVVKSQERTANVVKIIRAWKNAPPPPPDGNHPETEHEEATAAVETDEDLEEKPNGQVCDGDESTPNGHRRKNGDQKPNGHGRSERHSRLIFGRVVGRR